MPEKLTSKYILVLNCGSATVKFTLFLRDSLEPVLEGVLERIGLDKSFIEIIKSGQKNKITLNFPQGIKNHTEAIKVCFKGIETSGFALNTIVATGHRVVHGGSEFVKPTLITKSIFNKINKYSVLAPLHNPVNLQAMKAAVKHLPKVMQVAVFDTAFYSFLPEKAKVYPLPYKFYKQYNIQRYGFHGTSHEYVAKEAASILGKPFSKVKLITCHLGSGCSITAIDKGRAIETSMGFTPLEGLMMSTRSGSIDPAIVTFLQKELKIGPAEVEKILQSESGFKGLTGTPDVREVLVRAGYTVSNFSLRKRFNRQEKKQARLALKIFVYQVQKYIASYVNILGEIDAIVFTAGIGERNFTIRRMIMKGINVLKGKKFKVLVVPTDEELAIAEKVKKIL